MDKIDGLLRAVAQWQRYKDSLAGVRFMAGLGHKVPETKARDFIGEINAASRLLMTEMQCQDPDVLEALGEISLNACKMLREPEITRKQEAR